MDGSENPPQEAVQQPYLSPWNAVSLSFAGAQPVGQNHVAWNDENRSTSSNHPPANAERAAHARRLRGTRGAESSPSELPDSAIHHGATSPSHGERTACSGPGVLRRHVVGSGGLSTRRTAGLTAAVYVHTPRTQRCSCPTQARWTAHGDASSSTGGGSADCSHIARELGVSRQTVWRWSGLPGRTCAWLSGLLEPAQANTAPARVSNVNTSSWTADGPPGSARCGSNRVAALTGGPTPAVSRILQRHGSRG